MEREFQRTRPRGAKMMIRLKSGKELKERVDNLRSMTPEDLEAKFRAMSQVVLDADRSEKLMREVHSLDSVPNLTQLLPLLVRE